MIWLPGHQTWRGRWMLSDQVITHDSDARVGYASLLLSCRINDSELAPVYWSGQEVWAHITDEWLIRWDFFEGKLIVLNSITSLIIDIVEKVRVLQHIPSWLPDRAIAYIFCVIHYIHLACLRSLFDYGCRPNSSDQKVSRLLLAHQVKANRTELHLCTALRKENMKVVRDVEYAP